MRHYNTYRSDLLEKDFYPVVRSYYYRTWEKFYMDVHDHEDIEIMYVIDGQCEVEIETQVFPLKKGNFILLDARNRHRLIVEQDHYCRMLNIEIDFVEKEDIYPSIRKLVSKNDILAGLFGARFTYLIFKDTLDIYQTLKSIVLEMDTNSDEVELMVYAQLTQLFILLSRMIDAQKKKEIEKVTNRYVKKTIDFLHQNYDVPLKMPDIGNVVNLHPGYLHRIFKEHTNQTVIDYLTHLRMNKAKMLLTETEIPIIDIALYIGVNSRQYFSLLFKKYTQQSPYEYRKNHQRQV
ncbi:AraC family transcriptional regulator [Alkalihalobacillus pseudalcaliphilus]|uniref:AraC family transcriptional regulator n=1 Tax=Alkalihalobacillus pseudalcaliphilus TaxID=79884 RepID=UPI00064D7D94|nr:AraC family transcriptional regulator [Alkalihalobacillus pseudalcaliphilus]KMK75088.1 hypothetical protein AB990_16670 [Alkalihalobacillus pseudalcaliphilus]